MSEKVEKISPMLSLIQWINLELAENPDFGAEVEEVLAEMKQNKLKTAQHNKLKTAQHNNLKVAHTGGLRQEDRGIMGGLL